MQVIGKASVAYGKDIYLQGAASVVGKKESEGPLGKYFDEICPDERVGGTSWEEAESNLQIKAVGKVLEKTGVKGEAVRFMLGGDLLGQCMATSFGIADYQLPFLGLYGACSTCGEGLLVGSMLVAGGMAERVLSVTSSHFSSAEKEFRFPLEYGNQRPLSATWTVTGSGAFIMTSQGEKHCGVKITGGTVGKIVDYGLKDSMNMGACMAPAAADTIVRHLCDFNRRPDDYDKIITGDLGYVGQEVLLKLLDDKGFDLHGVHTDCGILIYDKETQDTHSGGSGCGCAAVTLAAYIVRQIASGEWKRVLFLPTGALLSKTSFNEGKSVPAICHGVVLEQV